MQIIPGPLQSPRPGNSNGWPNRVAIEHKNRIAAMGHREQSGILGWQRLIPRATGRHEHEVPAMITPAPAMICHELDWIGI